MHKWQALRSQASSDGKQPTNQPASTNQPTNQATNQATNKRTNAASAAEQLAGMPAEKIFRMFEKVCGLKFKIYQSAPMQDLRTRLLLFGMAFASW